MTNVIITQQNLDISKLTEELNMKGLDIIVLNATFKQQTRDIFNRITNPSMKESDILVVIVDIRQNQKEFSKGIKKISTRVRNFCAFSVGFKHPVLEPSKSTWNVNIIEIYPKLQLHLVLMESWQNTDCIVLGFITASFNKNKTKVR